MKVRALAAVLLLGAAAVAGCTDGAVIADESQVDSAAPPDAPEGETTADTSVEDTGSAEDSSAPTPDTSTTDTAAPFDGTIEPPGETGGTFSCGSETCSDTLQFCRRGTTPGICPSPDSGTCPAGCPGCPPLPLKCENMPMKCWAKPSCNCILVEICGKVTAGTCTPTGSGFTVGCDGV